MLALADHMRALRLLLLGFAIGAGAAFVASLIRQQRLSVDTGYVAPVAADGPLAVPNPPVNV
jgi:hypothetical protein